ncbi:MAG: IPT/TIG domain-containing protein [Candidatus Dormibacteria bacterium]
MPVPSLGRSVRISQLESLRRLLQGLARPARPLLALVPFALAGFSLAPVSASNCSGSVPTPAQVTGFSPHSGSPGTNVEVDGQNFGSSGTVSFNGVLSQILSWSNTQALVGVPDGAGSGPVVFCSNTYQSSSSPIGSFTFIPQITAVSPNLGHEGDQVTISGRYFGQSEGSVNFGLANQNCSDPTVRAGSWTDTTIQVAVPKSQCTGAITLTIPATDGSGNINSPAGPVFSILPQITQVDPAASYAGGPDVQVLGQGFGGGTAATLTFGGLDVTHSASWTDTLVSFPVPDGTDGGTVSVTVNGHQDTYQQAVVVNPHLSAVKPTAAAVGVPITLRGTSFGASGQVMIGQNAFNADSWSEDSVVFRVPEGSAPGSIALIGTGRRSVNSLSFTLTPALSGLDPSSAGPGEQVVVSGSTFGPQQGPGYITVNGQKVTPSLWGDSAIAFAVPKSAHVGQSYQVSVVTAYGVAAGHLPLSITAPAPNSPASTSGGTAAASYRPGGEWHKPPKPPSPIDLSVSATPSSVKPGTSVDVTAVLTLNGKPLAGSPIDLSVLYSPGSDATITPSHLVTGTDGKVHARMVTSSKPGDNIVVAQSGQFSDQDRVVGQGTVAEQGLPAEIGGVVAPRSVLAFLRSPALIPFLLVGLAALGLIGGGVYLNLRSPRHAFAGAVQAQSAHHVPVEVVAPVIAAAAVAVPRRRSSSRKQPATEGHRGARATAARQASAATQRRKQPDQTRTRGTRKPPA